MSQAAQKAMVARVFRWQPSLPVAEHAGGDALTVSEREAIASFLECRSSPARRQTPSPHITSRLERLLSPLRAAFDVQRTKPADRRGSIAVMLRECLKLDRVFWAWNQEQWVAVLGHGSLEFRARQRPRVSQSVRVEIAALAYLHGWFRETKRPPTLTHADQSGA